MFQNDFFLPIKMNVLMSFDCTISQDSGCSHEKFIIAHLNKNIQNL